MRVLPLLAMLLAAVTACGAPAGSSGEIACTAIGTPVGIGINVSPHAGKADSATLVACWQAGCTTRTVRLYPASGAVGLVHGGADPHRREARFR
jgi:hypothetical protein